VDLSQITDTSDGYKPCDSSRMLVAGDMLQICKDGGGVASIMTEIQFNSMFPDRNASRYTYDLLVSASKRGLVAAFCNGNDETANKRELAMFLANAAHESGNFIYVCEDCSNPNCGQCPSNYNYGGDSTRQYYGRGALQLSWNYNYQAAGTALGVDFLSNPSIVGNVGDYVFSTALWFWVQSNGGGCHNAAQQNGGFGQTIKIINGGLECGKAPGSVGYNEMMDRVNRYKNYAGYFGVDPGNNLTC